MPPEGGLSVPHGSGFVPDVPEVSVKNLSPSGLFARENPCVGEIFIRHSGTAAREAGGKGMLGGG